MTEMTLSDYVLPARMVAAAEALRIDLLWAIAELDRLTAENKRLRDAEAMLKMQIEVISEALAEKAEHLRNATERAQAAEAKLRAAAIREGD